MKKIILMLLLLPNIVLASVVYTDYEQYLIGVEDYLKESDLIKREEYKIYNTYYEQTEELYKSLDENFVDYNIDYNNYITEKKYTLEKTKYSKNYQIKCLNDNYYIDRLNITGFSNELELSEVGLSNSQSGMGYGIGIQNYTGYKKNAYDGKEFDKTIKINSNTKISMNLFERFNLEDLIINLYFPKQYLNNTQFTITLNDKYIYKVNFIAPNETNNKISITFDNSFNNFIKDNKFDIQNNCVSYFESEIPLYKHTKNIKIPLNNYIPLNDIDNFLLEDFQIKYNYYKRDKIEIEDNIFLNTSKFDIKNYIKFSTIPLEKLNIIHNINYEQSNTYSLKIFYNKNLLIEKPIIYEKEDIKIDQPKENIRETTKKVTEKQTTIKNNTTTKKITTKKILTLKKTTSKQTTQALKKLNNTITISKRENKSQKIIFISVISFLLLLLIIFEIILLYVKRKYF